MAEGETDRGCLAAPGDDRLRCNKAELMDALTGAVEPIQRRVLRLYLERVTLLDQQNGNWIRWSRRS